MRKVLIPILQIRELKLRGTKYSSKAMRLFARELEFDSRSKHFQYYCHKDLVPLKTDPTSNIHLVIGEGGWGPVWVYQTGSGRKRKHIELGDLRKVDY